MQQNAPFCVLLKNNFLGGGGGQTLDPLPLLVSRGLACMQLCVSVKGDIYYHASYSLT